jgi:hypothetical protein
MNGYLVRIAGIVAILLALVAAGTAKAPTVSATDHKFVGKLVLYQTYDCDTLHKTPDSKFRGFTFTLYDDCTGQKLGSCQTDSAGTCSFGFSSDIDTRLRVEFSGRRIAVSDMVSYGWDPRDAPYEFDFTYQSRYNDTNVERKQGGCAMTWANWSNSQWYCQ